MKAPRFPGLIAGNIGFGEEMSADIETSFLATLALRPKPVFFFDRALWQADIVREAYATSVLKSFGDSGLPLSEARTNEVLSHVRLLQPERVYQGLSFSQVSHLPGHPTQLSHPSLDTVITWRHRQFAQLVIVERLPHLTTMEMAHPDRLWRRMLQFFQEYMSRLRRQHYDLMPTEEKEHEFLALNFALFERLLFLRCQAANLTADYLRSIHDRVDDPEHPATLALEPLIDQGDHEHRLLHRRSRYHELIVNFHHRTVHYLNSLISNDKRS